MCFREAVFLMLFTLVHSEVEVWPLSNVVEHVGHYPGFVHIQNVVFNWSDGTFQYNSQSDLHSKLRGTSAVWPMTNVEASERECDRMYKIGIVYTIFYWGSTSNYYHLTYDMLIPLYKHMYFTSESSQQDNTRMVFMPTVETSRLKILNWETNAFDDTDKYWVTMSQFIAGDHEHLPLHRHLLEKKENLCFDELYFGVPRVNFTDEKLIRSYVKFVKSRFNIQDRRPTSDRMALVSRKGRRKILNEIELVGALQEVIPTDLVEFADRSFEDQVKSMSKYTVFAALNGAGLMNALYLPEHSTAIQMVPYRAGLNVKQYGNLIKTRGPYLEWMNKHVNLHHPSQGDAYNNRPDTTVHIEEFKDVVRQAVQLSKESYIQSLKSEL